MSVEAFIILFTAAVSAVVATAEFAVIKAAEWIFKAIKRKVRKRKRKQY